MPQDGGRHRSRRVLGMREALSGKYCACIPSLFWDSDKITEDKIKTKNKEQYLIIYCTNRYWN